MNEIDKENQNAYEINLQNQNHEKFNYFVNENEYHINIEIIKKKINVFQCRKCKTEFFFNNKLHRHLRIYRKKRNEKIYTIEIFHNESTFNRIIFSLTKSNTSRNLIFRA